MCGLFGMVGTLEHKHKRALRDLAFLNTLRGKDSTGLSCVHRNRRVSTRKMTIPGYEFIDHPLVDKAMEYNDQLWIGHGRAKTHGEVSRENAHPFEVLNEAGTHIQLIGAHNGTLMNKYEIEREINDKFETDSEGLFNLLYKAKDYKTAIGKLRGAWSLVWWNPLEDKLYFCRNKERPLVFAFTEDRKVMIWASEAWMLVNACLRNDVKLAKSSSDKYCFGTLPDHLYFMDIPQAKDQVLPELEREGGYEGAGLVARFQGGYGGWWSESEGDDLDDDIRFLPTGKKVEQETGKKASKETTKDAKDKSEEKDNVVEFDLYDPKTHTRGYKGEIISKEELEEAKKAGCVWSGCKIENTWAFMDEKSLICGKCLRDTHPKGEIMRLVQTDLEDDELPFDISSEEDPQPPSENSSEYKEMMAQSVKKAVG